MKLIALALLFIGCQTVKLRPDPNPASIGSNYLSIETVCNGKVGVGNNGCFAVGGNLDSINLKVRALNRGTLTIVSDICGIKWSAEYYKSQYIQVPLSKIMKKQEKSCLLGIMLSPEYPDQKDSTVKVHGFEGEVLLRSIWDDRPAKLYGLSDEWDGIIPIQTRRSPHDQMEFHPGVVIDPTDSTLGFYRIVGCGIDDSGVYPDDGLSTIDYDIDYSESCIFHGAIVPVDKTQGQLFTIMVNVFETNFNRLQEPIILERKGDLILDFDPEVTFVELGDRTYNDNQLLIPDFDETKRYIVRAYTVKGRFILGIHEGSFWIWYK